MGMKVFTVGSNGKGGVPLLENGGLSFLSEAMMNEYKDYLRPIMESTRDSSLTGRVGVLLENLSREANKSARRRPLGEAQVADFGPYKKYSLMLISTVMPSLIAEEIVSVQPLKQRLGQIFYLKYVYATTKGTTTSGTVASDVQTYGIDSSYSSSEVSEEPLGSSDADDVSLSFNLSYYPVVPGTVTISNGSVTVVDNGENVFTGSGLTSGTIDYATGVVSLVLTGASAGDWEATYEFDNTYAPATRVPAFDLRIEEQAVRAKTRKLRSIYSLDAAYDFEAQWGFSLDDELVKTTAGEIRAEIDQEVMADLYTQAGLTSWWNPTYPGSLTGVSYQDFKETFVDELIKASNAIFQATGRGTGTFVVVGRRAADVLESLPGWEPSGKEFSNGPHFAGTFRGRFKVYKDPFYGENEYLVGYKGNQFIDAGYVYAPYIPIFSTELITLDDFAGRRGYGTSYGKKMIASKYYVKGKIANSGW